MAVPAKLMIAQPGVVNFQSVFSSSMALPMAVMYPLLSMASAAALSCAYLVLRRNRDDFGRDYYNFSLRLAARWGRHPHARLPGLPGMALRGPARGHPDNDHGDPRWDTSGWVPSCWVCSAWRRGS